MTKRTKNQKDQNVKQFGKRAILIPRVGGCGEGWTCDRCPNLGCPANERN